MIYFKFNARIFIIKFYSQQILEYTFVYLYIYIWKESSLKNKLLAKKKKKNTWKKKLSLYLQLHDATANAW